MRAIVIASLMLSAAAGISRPQHGFRVDMFIMSVDIDHPLTMDVDFRREGDFSIFSGETATLTVKGKLSWEKKFKFADHKKFSSMHELRSYMAKLCQDDGESVGKAKFVSKSGDIVLASKGNAEKPKGKSSITAWNTTPRGGISYGSVSCD